MPWPILVAEWNETDNQATPMRGGSCCAEQVVKQEATAENVFHESLGSWIGLIVAIVVLTYVVYRIRVWFRDEDDEGPAGDVHQLLADADEMRRTGALTEAEYRSIQSQLSAQLGRGERGQRRPVTPAGDAVPADGPANP